MEIINTASTVINTDFVKKVTKHTSDEIENLSLEELRELYPNAPAQFLRAYASRRGKNNNPPRKSRLTEAQTKRKLREYNKEAVKHMKRISKHINTQAFMDHCNAANLNELIADLLAEVITNQDEKTENRLKAAAEVNKYTMVPSQAQEIKHEIDESFDDDKRARLAELMAKVQ